jgi:hypothetical protein
MEQLYPLRKENYIMKAKLKNILGLAALGVTLLATTVPTWAGRVLAPEVLLYSNQVFHYAYGSLVGARYSADSNQYIGCISIASNNPSNNLVICSARDNSVRNNFVCGSQDPKLQEVVQTMTDSSYISVAADRSNGQCRSITIYNESSYLK